MAAGAGPKMLGKMSKMNGIPPQGPAPMADLPTRRPDGPSPAGPPASDAAMASVPSPASAGLQQVMASLTPEQQQVVTAVMSDPVMLEAIDKITEMLAPEIAGGGMQGGSPPNEMMFGPKVS